MPYMLTPHLIILIIYSGKSVSKSKTFKISPSRPYPPAPLSDWLLFIYKLYHYTYLCCVVVVVVRLLILYIYNYFKF